MTPQDNRIEEARMETTVLIRTFNEAKHLPGLLARLADQTYRNFNTLVVDSGSIDGTRAIAEAWSIKVLRIDRSHFTFGYSLNAGIATVNSRFIAIVSAHTCPVGDTWLSNLVSGLRRDPVAMVYGKQIGWSTSKFSEVLDFGRTFSDRRETMCPPRFFANNANAAIRRDLWEQHPFDEELPGLEDVEWARHWMHLGYQVLYEPAAALHHIHEETAAQVRNRYYREAVAARRLGLRSRRHVVTEFGREAGRFVSDLSIAVRQAAQRELPKRLLQCAGEIASFRVNKALGTANGLLDGARLADARARDSVFFASSFDAVVIEGPGRATLRRRAMPRLRPGDVLIAVAYVGVCGTDLEIFHGTLGYFSRGIASYPIVPGHEMSGRIVAVGSSVHTVKPGDPVVVECIQSCGACAQCLRHNPIGCTERKELGVLNLDGAYAQYLVVPHRFVHRVGDDVELSRAALCEPLAVVSKGLRRLRRVWSRAEEHKRCAVVGGGPLGRLSGLLLAHLGHDVVLFDRDPVRAAIDEPRLTGSTTMAGLGEFDALVEATGKPEALETVLKSAAAGAAILLLGLPYARRDFNFEDLVAYDRTIVGSVGSSSEDFGEAVKLLPSLNLQPFLEHVLPLSRFQEAWNCFASHGCLKALIKVE